MKGVDRMSKDPVCGMDLDEDEAKFTSKYKGRTYHFCTSRCKASFDEDPEKYLQIAEGNIIAERKIAVVGTGQVGSTFAFALMMSGLADDIVLIDRNRDVAEGHAMDLNHSQPFSQPAEIHAGDYDECEDASIVVVTAGAPQKPGESRLDLVRKNTDIFKDIIPKIAEHNPRILLIVANPVDVLTYAALQISGYPMNRVVGSGTMLDTARFEYLVGQHCGVDSRSVQAHIIGEHGDSEVAVWSQVTVGGVPLKDYCPVCGKGCKREDKEEIFSQVKEAAYEIIDKKGATYYAIALALVRMCACILRDERSVLTVSTLVDGYYDIEGVCLSVPVILGRNGISKIIEIGLDQEEYQELLESARVLKDVISEIR